MFRISQPTESFLQVVFPRNTPVTCIVCPNVGLRSFQGCPDSVTEIRADNNPFLTDLSSLPSSVTNLSVSMCGIATLKNMPHTVTSLDVSNNQLMDLEGISNAIEHLRCSSNKITSLLPLAKT